MNATSVLTVLFNKGVHVSTQDDELVVDAPRGALEESDIRLIREHRDDIVELLRQIQLQREAPEPARRPRPGGGGASSRPSTGPSGGASPETPALPCR